MPPWRRPGSTGTSGGSGGRGVAGRKHEPEQGPVADPVDERERVAALFERAKRGDQAAMPAFLDALRDPDTLDTYGDVALYAQLALLKQLCGENDATRNAVAMKMAKIRLDL